jgi:hypothetical protein
VDIWLNRSDFEPPRRRIITSGCGGGMTFDGMALRQAPLNTHATVTPQQIFERMRDLYQAGTLYRVTQGIHTSALSDGERLVLVAEDVGRHNTVDRLWGKAMKQGIPTKGLILLPPAGSARRCWPKQPRCKSLSSPAHLPHQPVHRPGEGITLPSSATCAATACAYTRRSAVCRFTQLVLVSGRREP